MNIDGRLFTQSGTGRRPSSSLVNHLNALADFEQAAHYGAQRKMSASWQATVFYNWSRLYAGRQQWSSAATRIRQAIALNGDQPGYYKTLGDILQRLDDPAGAEAAYEQARSLGRD